MEKSNTTVTASAPFGPNAFRRSLLLVPRNLYSFYASFLKSSQCGFEKVRRKRELAKPEDVRILVELVCERKNGPTDADRLARPGRPPIFIYDGHDGHARGTEWISGGKPLPGIPFPSRRQPETRLTFAIFKLRKVPRAPNVTSKPRRAADLYFHRSCFF